MAIFPTFSPWRRAWSFIFHHPKIFCAKFGWNWFSGSGEKFLMSIIFVILLLLLLGKGQGPSFEQTWLCTTQLYFVRRLVENGTVVLEKKTNIWKVYDDDDKQRTGQILNRKAHLSLQLRWAKKQNKLFQTKLMEKYTPPQWIQTEDLNDKYNIFIIWTIWACLITTSNTWTPTTRFLKFRI